ncbi:hypothetical protein [Virgibacillus sp. DJP39]|uniref:hypothetical protein n=1 Tax=Virgibacillus sp. DJP39 TaxID=3409790 RepID=UPI003BB7A594
MKNTKKLYIYWGLFIVFVCCVSYVRLLYSSPFASSWDQVDFALAVTNFDLYQMQPHFPGYPYFILGGMLFNHLVNDSVQALSIFNTIMAVTSVVPIILILKSYVNLRANFLITASIYSMSYMWVLSTDPMSEAAAVAVLWWFIWSLRVAKEKPVFWISVVPLVFFSILMGIRLSYIPFGIGILLLWYSYHKHFSEWFAFVRFIFLQVIIAALLQFIWIGGLIMSAGGLSAFIELAVGFVGGHFTEWGGAISADSMPLVERLYKLIFHNFLWTGLFVQSLPLALIYILLLGLLVFCLKRKKCDTDPFTCWLIFMWVAYFLWVLFAQNVDKPRHILPLTGLFVFLLLKSTFRCRCMKTKSLNSICVVLISLQCIHGSHLIFEKTNQPPAVYQLTNYLTEIAETGPITVYTWEESRVMEFLKVPYQHKEIFTYEYFKIELPSNKKIKVFLTDQVIKGFEKQEYAVQNRIKKIETFQSNSLFNPVYGEISLYEWTGKKEQ